MHPILFQIGPLTLYSYGLLVAMGLLAGLTIADLEAKRLGWNRDWISKLVVIDFLMGLLGARILYVITRIGEEDVFKTLIDPHAGFVFYGGLVSSWLYLIWQVKKYNTKNKKKIAMWELLDIFAIAICIGEGIGRFGCLLGGCCFGKPTSLPFGVIMEAEKHLGHLHPVQAYEGLILIGLFFLLWKRRLHKKYSGESVVFFVGAYAIVRFIVEYFRGDLIRGFVIENVLSTSQFIGILLLIFTVLLHKYLKSRVKASK